MENELSEELKKYFKETDTHFQLVPPHIQRRNTAEREVRTSNNHFIDTLYTVDPKLPF